ncbi:MAG: PLP-dependent aminotransferase family protein [Clostridium sp.]|nr:PLP-dependent aminotransferase family protein [Clostridium sp.]
MERDFSRYLNEEGALRYMRVYRYYRSLIEEGKLEAGVKLPSIRTCSIQLNLSRTTVETAYLMLAAEGYIAAKPQSGYYVTDLERTRRGESWHQTEKRKKELLFDFSSSRVDRESFRFEVWRRYVKSALRQDERLLSYGEPQGERELREELSRYLRRHRNVVCTPDQIVVGAGVQSLLHILCPMVHERSQVLMNNESFHQGRTVFEDHGFSVSGIEGEKTELPAGSIFYLTPSQITSWGGVMGIGERMSLMKAASEKNLLLIEDDYNSEFSYYNRPTPSLQGLSGGKGVVYMGTFSRLLLPSIRMSFMVLPPELLPAYQRRGAFYNQTASKAEQIALCQFIRDGHLEAQIRKSRRLYLQKAKLLCEEIQKTFGEKAKACPGEAGFLVLAELQTELLGEEIRQRAEMAGVGVRMVDEKEWDRVFSSNHFLSDVTGTSGRPQVQRILLSCASVPAEHYKEALFLLKQSLGM